jgi:outer membrane protein TolC
MQMEYLYKEVQQKAMSYQSAKDGWPAAEAKLAQAERKLALGMISRAEYLAEEIAWMTAKANKEQAALNLQAAMETYEWAIKGLVK